jgi:hypothetical protein
MNEYILDEFETKISVSNTEIFLEIPNDLTFRFSNGYSILKPCKIALKPGSDEKPQSNYVYIPKSTKNLEMSLDSWPKEEHIRISYMSLQSFDAIKQDEKIYVHQESNKEID